LLERNLLMLHLDLLLKPLGLKLKLLTLQF
jgi:hypothetical protein